MKTIIKVTLGDGQTEYISSTHPQIETTSDINSAKLMEFSETIAVALALGTMGIPHSMITNPKIEK